MRKHDNLTNMAKTHVEIYINDHTEPSTPQICLSSEMTRMILHKSLDCLVVLLMLLLLCESRLVSCDVNTRKSEKHKNSMDNTAQREASQNNSCPPQSCYDELNEACKCYHYNETPICEHSGEQLNILKSYCITYDKEKGVASAGECIYEHPSFGYYYPIQVHNYSDLNEALCGRFNRKGLFCSECADGTYISSYSYRESCIGSCKPSTVNWIKYFLITLIPTTVFYSLIVLFRINVHSSRFQGCIFLIQFATSPFASRITKSHLRILKDDISHNVYTFIYILAILYGTIGGIWNLDFFRDIDTSICLGLSPLGQLSLDFVTVLYTLLLITGTYFVVGWHDQQVKVVVIACKPFLIFFKLFRENWNAHSSTIDSLATFLILCNIKVLNVCFDILKPVKVHQLTKEGGYRWSVFYDPKLSYLGKDHLPHAIFALLMLVIFVIVPIAILLLYPARLFQKFLTNLPSRWQIFLKILVDSFQGIYKDGTEPNTRDFRWFSAFPFIVRLVMMSLYIYSLDSFFLVNCGTVLSIAGILIIIANPYKANVRYISTHFAVFLLITAATVVILMVSSRLYLPYFLELTLLLTLTSICSVLFLSYFRVCCFSTTSIVRILKRKLCQ